MALPNKLAGTLMGVFCLAPFPIMRVTAVLHGMGQDLRKIDPGTGRLTAGVLTKGPLQSLQACSSAGRPQSDPHAHAAALALGQDAALRNHSQESCQHDAQHSLYASLANKGRTPTCGTITWLKHT